MSISFLTLRLLETRKIVANRKERMRLNMMEKNLSKQRNVPLNENEAEENHKELYISHAHLSATFGDNWFSKKAEAFARFFGTPLFLSQHDHRQTVA